MSDVTKASDSFYSSLSAASDEDFGGSVQNLSPELTGYLRTRLVEYLCEEDRFSAQIQQRSGQQPLLVCTLGTGRYPPGISQRAESRDNRTRFIQVKNLPSSIDTDVLELFFESRKKQGGGPVKHVSFDKDRVYALVEFEESRSVDIVMDKVPIKLLDNTLDIKRYTPLLEESETIQKLEINGLPSELSKHLRQVHLEGLSSISTFSSSSKPQESTTRMIPITREEFGTLDGRPVYRYSLKNRNNVEIRITNYGGNITNIFTPDKNGQIDDIVLGYDTFEEYIRNKDKYGGVLGRYANRIAGGRFTLDGITYQLEKNLGPNHLHGGPTGFHKRLWDSKVEGGKLVLSYTSLDDEEGYPGTVKASVSFRLTDKNKLRIHFSATTTKPTIINLASYNYYNLAGQASGTLKGHTIRLAADKYLPMDRSCIPLGSIESVNGSVFDLTQDTDLGERLLKVPGNKGFDHTYCLEKPGWIKHAARVKEAKSGRVLDFYTTKPGVKLYTVYYIDGQKGKSGVIYRKYDGFTLEATHYPDSPNKPSFPSPVVRPGEEYSHKTVLKFSVEKYRNRRAFSHCCRVEIELNFTLSGSLTVGKKNTNWCLFYSFKFILDS